MQPQRVQRVVATGLLLAYLPSCSSWQVQNVEPAVVLQDRPPTQLRVTQQDGHELTLAVPHLSGDSLVGSIRGSETGIPLRDVRTVAVRRGNAAKTLGLVGLIVGGIVVVAALATPNPLKGLELCTPSPCEGE